MTMMISKFHKLIQSRILWGAFLIVIIFSFVIWGMMPGSATTSEGDQPNAAGTLDGNEISFDEYNASYLSVYLARALQYGRDIPSTTESENWLRQAAWQRLATLREANRLGISATDAEVVAAIRSAFSSPETGYNPEYYETFAQNTLRPLGFSKPQFEHHIRQEITMQKLGRLIGRQAVVTPLEIRRTFETLTDSFTIDYALIAPDPIEKELTVDEAAAQALFDEDPARFTLPERRDISYAVFPIDSFRNPDAPAPTDDDLLDYYEVHIKEFTTTETDTNGQPAEVVADFEDVKADITAAIARETALEATQVAADELYYSLLPGGTDIRVPDFVGKAKEAGRATQTLTGLSRSANPIPDAGPAFAATAFTLGLDTIDRAGPPVVGSNNVYVLYLDGITPPRVPAFDEVRTEVLAAARQQALVTAMTEKAAAVKAAATEGIAKGDSLKTALKDLDVPVRAAPTFTGIDASSTSNAVVQALVQSVITYNQGEITEPIPAADGLLVAYIKARQPADPATYDAYAGEMSSVILNRRAQTLYAQWQQSLLTPDRFVDLQRAPANAEDTFDEDYSAAAAVDAAEAAEASEAPAEDTPAAPEAADESETL